MPRKGQKCGEDKPPGDPNDPFGFIVLSEAYFQWMGVKNYSKSTIKNRRTYIKYFIRWCDDRGLAQPSEITRPILERYQRYLYYYRKENGEPLNFRSQHLRLSTLRALKRDDGLLYHVLWVQPQRGGEMHGSRVSTVSIQEEVIRLLIIRRMRQNMRS